MKRITIDARTLETSTGRYTQHLLTELHALGGYDYTVLVPSEYVAKWQKLLPKFTIMPADQKSYSFGEQVSFQRPIRATRANLVHFTMPQQPLFFFRPAVTTIHDTTLIRFENVDMNPVMYKIRKWIFTFLIWLTITRAKAIVCPTEYVKHDLVNFMHGKHADKIFVTLESGDPFDVTPEPIKDLAGKKFLFWVGNAFPYKNIQRIIEAFAELKKTQPGLQLALAGKKDYFYEQLEKYVDEHVINDVHFLGFISDGEKRWAFQNAEAYVVASLSEGFHIPLLEAMYEDCPVISSTATCLPEVAGDAALYFDPYSTDDLVKAIKKLQDDKQLRADLIKKGQIRVTRFSWKRMAEQTKSIYDKVLQ